MTVVDLHGTLGERPQCDLGQGTSAPCTALAQTLCEVKFRVSGDITLAYRCELHTSALLERAQYLDYIATIVDRRRK